VTNAAELWQRYRTYLCRVPSLGLTLDVSRMGFDEGFLASMSPTLASAFAGMEALEKGAIANPDEKRMVGHYWLRTPELAPTPEITAEIRKTIADVKVFAGSVHSGQIRPPKANRYTSVLCIGIGGSALGPMFVADALGDPASDKMQIDFIDNTDPDGIARTLRQLDGRLPETLCNVHSRFGGWWFIQGSRTWCYVWRLPARLPAWNSLRAVRERPAVDDPHGSPYR
jgi:glucose-6-phosphate isomerase